MQEKRMSRFVALTGLGIGLFMFIACAPQPANAPAASSAETSANTLTAIKVPAVVSDTAASYWVDAPVLTVHTKASSEGQPDGADVNVQAVYDDQAIAMRLEWADTTKSDLNKAWVWDGSAFSRSPNLGDRMGVLFAMENNAEFAAKGCAAACHNSDQDVEKWWMGADSADLHYDLWQWTAATTNPVNQAQDQWLNVLDTPADSESATHPDDQTGGGSLSNTNEAKDGPAYVNGADLTSSFIITGQQAPIELSQLANGAAIPTSILAPWVGSRGDVTANGVWQDDKWVVVLVRTLDTGHEDDVVFTPPKSYPLGLAIFDHNDLVNHTTAPDVVTLEWK